MQTNRRTAWVTLLAGSATLWGAAWSCNPHFNTCEERLDCVDGNPNASGGAGGAGSGGSSNGSGGKAETCEDLDCLGLRPHCDEEALKCVECLETEHCTKATASVCEEGKCVSCSTNEDCEHVEGKGICDGGECVACTIEDESACGDNSCNPATKTCTETKRGSRSRCLSCVADSECQQDYRCVPMEFQGQPREGGYCLKVGTAGCTRPFTVPTPPRQSLSGAPVAAYCGVGENSTTCEAVLELLGDVECPGGTDAECGALGLEDARCEVVNFVANRCTYSCSGGAQCPTDYNCGSDANNYCGFVE